MPQRFKSWKLVLLVAFVGTTVGLEAVCGAETAAARRPNVVMVAIDDLNDWVGPLGGHPQVQTPAMDQLAARGTTFTNAHCQAPLCNPSRTSLLTGMHPHSTGVYALEPWFRESPELKDLVTLPQHLRANGYRTLTAGKIYHGSYPPKNQKSAEFDVWGPGSSVGVRPDKKLVETPMGNHPLVDWGAFPHHDEDKGDWKIASWAEEQLASLAKDSSDEPFFLSAGFFLPHVPCYVSPPWLEKYPLAALRLPPILDSDRDDTPEISWYLHWTLPEPRLSWMRENHQLENLVQAYLACTTFVDSQLGRILQAVEQNGLSDHTIVVVWSDHGWHLGEKGITGKNSLWERSTRVPVLFAGPGISANAKCNRPAQLLDLYPTLCELCGLDIPAHVEGHSLLPHLRDAAAPREWPAITTHNPGNFGIRTETHRYIHYADGSEELYDMVSDPNEWQNLAGDARLASVLAELRQWVPKESHAPLPGSRSRLLVRDGEQWIWEGKPIDPTKIWK